jgi:hypothetical protein
VSQRPLDYSTRVPVHQTVAECSSLLAQAGAGSVTVEYDRGEPSGLGFMLETPHGKRHFVMPVRVDGVAAMLNLMLDQNPPNISGGLRRLRTREHVVAVAWRQVRHWLAALAGGAAGHHRRGHGQPG